MCLPLYSSLLQKSTLGKLSRARFRTAFESGQYKTYQQVNDETIETCRAIHYTPPSIEAEKLLLQEFQGVLKLPTRSLRTFLKGGVTSIDLIKVTRAIERRLHLTSQIPISTMLTHGTVRSLAKVLEDPCSFKRCDPIVTLQNQGEKNSAITNPPRRWRSPRLPSSDQRLPRPSRPRHPCARLHARELYFHDIPEAVDIYHAAIKHHPTGPYALASYSYGSTLAFKTAKVLERNGDEVRFLASFNLPPHIEARTRQLDWTECPLNLAYFLDLMTEQRARELSPLLRGVDRSQALERVVGDFAAPARMAELSLTPDALAHWVGVAFSLQSMARNYEPGVMVGAMDVF